MSNSATIQHLKKAGITSCLFLLWCQAVAQDKNTWLAEPTLTNAYSLVLNLQLEEARETLGTTTSPQYYYLASLADMLELVLTEDEVRFEKLEDEYEDRLAALEDSKPLTAHSLFAQAELRLHWAFVYLKFGHELDAAWNIRQSYLLVQECKKKFPEFAGIKKTSGVLEVMLGAVPEKYQWVLNLFGMQGSSDKGLTELLGVQEKDASLKLESAVLFFLIQGYILQETSKSVEGISQLLAANPSNTLLQFIAASLAIKNAQSEMALSLLKKSKEHHSTNYLVYTDYQFGEVYLHKGEYALAIDHYKVFINTYRGLNFLKDAHYKTGICFLLMGNVAQAQQWFNRAKQEGKESTEADKYAARSLAENSFPNVQLSKLRYATDGGYYEAGKQLVLTITAADIPSSKDKVEFIYRKARLYDKSGAVEEAIKLYKQTIDAQKFENWYFAPNACLQLGYIYSNQNNTREARNYFEKALSYKKHEYKNSIDSKAKSAIEKLARGS